MDDLVCVGSTWEENLKNVKIVLQTLRDNSLSANLSKTELAMEEIEYLGFRLSQQGVKVSQRKLNIIEKLEIRSVERGICPIATSTINERTVPILIAGCMAHEREGCISTSGLKFDVTLVLLDPDFLQDAQISAIRP